MEVEDARIRVQHFDTPKYDAMLARLLLQQGRNLPVPHGIMQDIDQWRRVLSELAQAHIKRFKSYINFGDAFDYYMDYYLNYEHEELITADVHMDFTRYAYHKLADINEWKNVLKVVKFYPR